MKFMKELVLFELKSSEVLLFLVKKSLFFAEIFQNTNTILSSHVSDLQICISFNFQFSNVQVPSSFNFGKFRIHNLSSIRRGASSQDRNSICVRVSVSVHVSMIFVAFVLVSIRTHSRKRPIRQ